MNDFRIFLAEGGRGGGKSQAVGRILLYLGEKRCLRIVCGRETQNTIAESVYSLMADLVREYGLNYEIQASKLIHRTSGTEITFRGFRQQGAFNIQGMEGIDIVWIDEAQALTKQTIDVLTPTIRKERSKIFFTMNRHIESDPAFEYCKDRDDVLHVHINYFDNEHCTSILKKDAATCQAKSTEDYNHIWLGIPLSKSEDAVFSLEEINYSNRERYQLRHSYGMRIAGFDIARYGDDKCACVIIQQMGALHWEVFHVEQWSKKDLSHTTGKILELYNQYECAKAIIDEDGIGAGPLDNLNKGRQMDTIVGFRNPPIAYKDNKQYANNRTVNTYKLKDMIEKSHIVITQDEAVKELCTMRYTFDHHQRKILVSKEQMRKDKIKSPNVADAVIMAVSLIGEVKEAQDKQYSRDAHQQVAPDCNLFEYAGV